MPWQTFGARRMEHRRRDKTGEADPRGAQRDWRTAERARTGLRSGSADVVRLTS